LFFDLETIPNEEALQFVDMPKAPKNIKDAEKVEEAISAKYAEIIANAALDADLCQIKSIAYAVGTAGEVVVNIVNKKMSEKQALSDFWDKFGRCGGYSVGYNILGFDFPVLLRRSFELGVVPTMTPSLIKYRTDPTCDLMQIFSNWDWHFTKPLKWVCKRYGIEIPAGYEVNGSQVATMNEKQLRVYAASDVVVLQSLYKRMNGYYFVH
jgi:hypothetical protein